MKKILVLAAAISVISCKTAKNDLSPDAVESKYINSITAESLTTNLKVVASDEMQGRDTGSEGQKKAGRYLVSQYKNNKIPFPKGATEYYQHVPAAYLKLKSGETLPDSENIWAYIEGSEKPDEIVVVSAHYDHVGVIKGEIYNGADDDGSGTVALVEIAKAFEKAKKEGHGPKRSILILHMTGEEHGLLGSSYYSQNPLFPIKNTVADINIDMIGRRDEPHSSTNNYIYIIGADRLSTDLDHIVSEQNKKFTNMALDYTFNDRNDPNHFYERSDHYNFGKNGIPSVFFFSGVHADYHKATDKVEKIEFDALTRRAKLAFATAWEIANRPERIVVDKNGK
jgi:Zn-dependent M28 family amino/carboxypeptidase